MPAIQPVLPLLTFVQRATNNSSSLPAQTSPKPIEVVCAFPVSGQYGPGSRVLYYALVAACVLARKEAWIRDACLAGALLFPAVAALHGIVLAAMHTEGAVDMDIYGAFQLLAIGILTAPPSVRLSKTYWSQVQGRNVIFIWIILVLAGLLGLTVEFYRANTSPCNGVTQSSRFPWGEDNACGLRCSVESGPYSPMRQGAAKDIYVIPAPKRITFGMGMLFSAACCVPAVLALISIYHKLVETKRRKKKRQQQEGTARNREDSPERIDRTNQIIRGLLRVVEVPVFGGAVLALVILGELNFWSTSVNYMTERIGAIGQWAPIAGTAIAIIGTIAIRVAQVVQPGSNEVEQVVSRTSSEEEKRRPTIEFHPAEENSNGHQDVLFLESAVVEEPDELPPSPPPRAQMKNRTDHLENPLQTSSEFDPDERLQHTETFATTSSSSKADAGRSKFASLVSKVTGSPARDRDEAVFRTAKTMLPELPGERNRNANWMQQSESFRRHRGSFTNSAAPSLHGDSGGDRSRDPSPYRGAGPSRSSTVPVGPASTSPTSIHFETRATRPYGGARNRTESDPFGGSSRGEPLKKSMTLEIPKSTR